MNKKAEEIGLENTNFVTPHGLDDLNHYTTAYSLAVLTDYALNNEKFASIVNTKTKTILVNGAPRELINTNELLGNVNGITGVKTGFTNNAGRCLVASCVRGDMDLVSVVLGADTKNFRTKDSIKIIEYAYDSYKMVDIKAIINNGFEDWYEKNKNTFTIEKGQKQTIGLNLEHNTYMKYPIKKGEERNIKIEIDCKKYFEAPVEKNKIIGKMKIASNKENILELDVLTNEDIKKKEIKDYLCELFGQFRLITIFGT